MKKLIFIICFLGLIANVQAQGPKGKFMLTAKTAYSFALEGVSPRGTYFGSEISYFLDRQLLLGMNFDYLEYHESGGTREIEYSQTGYWDLEGNIIKWYNFGLFTKLLFDISRFTPFVKMGFGFYVPQRPYYRFFSPDLGSYSTKITRYGKTCLGMNLGAGLQYRVWNGLCLQTEALLTTLTDRNKESNLNRNFTYANLNAGLSIIF